MLHMGAVMTIEDQAIFLENVDDGTGTNSQRGYFAVSKMVGPFTSEIDAKDYLEKESQTQD